jgi:hypothetical protein
MKLTFSHHGATIAVRHTPGITCTPYGPQGADVALRNSRTRRLIAYSHNSWWLITGTNYAVDNLTIEEGH